MANSLSKRRYGRNSLARKRRRRGLRATLLPGFSLSRIFAAFEPDAGVPAGDEPDEGGEDEEQDVLHAAAAQGLDPTAPLLLLGAGLVLSLVLAPLAAAAAIRIAMT